MSSHQPDSIFNEPQYAPQPLETEQSDLSGDEQIRHAPEDIPIGQGAWDEPTLSRELAGNIPDHVQKYSDWLADGIARTSFIKSWSITLALILVSGLWAVFGAIFNQSQTITLGGLLLVVLIGPLTEEMMKGSATLITVEKWPYLFRSAGQIMLCCMAAGAGFSILENLIYLYIYIHHPSATIILWRWTVCVVLHTGCSLIFSLGIINIWRETMTRGTMPQVALGTKYFITAACLHGSYNFLAILINPWMQSQTF